MSDDHFSGSSPAFASPGERSDAPGARLKRAREKAGLSLPEVANLLHLTVTLISELESDDYHQIAGLIFARGYLRAYARLLTVSETLIMNEFDNLEWPAHFTAQSPLKAASTVETTRESRVFRCLRFFIIFALLIVIGLWWRSQQGTDKPVRQSDVALPVRTAITTSKVDPGVRVGTESEIPRIQSDQLASNEEPTMTLEMGSA